MIGNKVEQAGCDYADECCDVFRRFKQSSANWRPWSASNRARGNEGLRTIMRRNQRKDVGRRIKKHNVLKSMEYKAKATVRRNCSNSLDPSSCQPPIYSVSKRAIRIDY